MNRRTFLRLSAAALGATALGSSAAVLFGRRSSTTSTPRVGSGQLSGHVVLPQGFRVPPGESWYFDPDRSTTVEVAANVIVEGTLSMRPSSPDVTHVLRFVDVDESAYRGGGMEVLDTDVGLWVIGAGVLDLQGTPRASWARTGSDPSWLPGDELVITPTEPEDFACRPFRTGDAVPQAYEDVPLAEVLNLTRNVIIEGTPEGRAHTVFLQTTQPQNLSHALFRHMGPRQEAERQEDQKIVGRWPIHFHFAGEGSRGSVVEGCLVRDAGSHAFVAHESHGVTFRECVAYDVEEAAYWWDQGDQTHDTLYERCVAANVASIVRNHALAGFEFQLGRGNRAVACVATAVGNRGAFNASGFFWPGKSGSAWDFEDCVAHNNTHNGIFWWQNNIDDVDHETRGFVAYNNGRRGIFQGAYKSPARHFQATLRGNEFEHHAQAIMNSSGVVGGSDQMDIWGREYALVLSGTVGQFRETPVVFVEDRYAGYQTAPVFINCNGRHREWHFVRCTRADGFDLTPEDFRIEGKEGRKGEPLDFVVRVQRTDGTAYEFGPDGVARDISALPTVSGPAARMAPRTDRRGRGRNEP